MITIGTYLQERYEILQLIGSGGMSDVYKARCHKLNRYVAIKVLKEEYRNDRGFVSKFRAEAQAAARLAHPNVVNVYDVGDEEGINYIIMELVEGITLKKYIEKKARLSYKEAVSIAIQVSMGIGAAHNNHIIHRDIKPQNIIISKDGKVKVTDFGIAKAATSNTITSNVMGSVHYTSPEQARGGYSDEKSDIYSLGITLFEMLTGRVPFNGETTVAIAIKHIQEEMTSPKEFVAEIPTSVENIVLKCCQKSPDRRYQNVQEVIADLKQSLINPDENFVVQNDPDSEGGTRMITDSDIAQIKRQSGYREVREYPETESGMRLRSDTEQMYEGEEDDEDYDYDPRMERVTTILAVVAGIIICIIIIVLALKIFGGFGNQSGIESPIELSGEMATTDEMRFEAVPDVKGINVEDAKKTLHGLGFKTEVIYQESDVFDKDVVISTDAKKDTMLAVGSTVVLTVSAGAQGVEVPKVTGLSFEEASNILVNQGFLVNKAENYSDTVEAGYVISQTPAEGTKAPKGNVITVNVSRGKEEVKVRVPNLVGKTEMDGRVEATELGLVVGSVAYVYSAEVEEGLICYQSYSHGSYVEEGTVIDLKVSQGAEQLTYRCNASIEAPTVEEAPDYVAGSEVHILLVPDGGTPLLDTTVTTFPQAANYHGLTASGGTLTMTYKITTAGSTTTDPNTGEVVNVPGEEQTKSFTRRIEFVPE